MQIRSDQPPRRLRSRGARTLTTRIRSVKVAHGGLRLARQYAGPSGLIEPDKQPTRYVTSRFDVFCARGRPAGGPALHSAKPSERLRPHWHSVLCNQLIKAQNQESVCRCDQDSGHLEPPRLDLVLRERVLGHLDLEGLEFGEQRHEAGPPLSFGAEDPAHVVRRLYVEHGGLP